MSTPHLTVPTDSRLVSRRKQIRSENFYQLQRMHTKNGGGEEVVFGSYDQLTFKSNQQPVVNPVILRRLHENVLDSFVFKFASIVCSLEYNQLVDCFQEANESPPSSTATFAHDPNCVKSSTEYGNCVYKRFNHVVGFLCSQQPLCKSDYMAYEQCLKLTTWGSTDEKLPSYTWNHVQGTKHTIPYSAICENFFWRPLYKCVTGNLHIDPKPFDK